MLVYEKKVTEGASQVRHLFYSTTDVPAENDQRVTFKDIDGDVLTDVTLDDIYLDDTKGGMVRTSDGKFVAMLAGTTPVIPNGNWTPETKTIESIEVTTLPTKVDYVVNETLDLTGMVVKAVYKDGDKVELQSSDYTTSPTAGTSLSTAGKVTVTVTHTESEKTTTFDVNVSEPVVTTSKSKKASK